MIRPVVAAVVAAVVVTVAAGGDEGDTTVLLAGEGHAGTMTVRLHLPALAASGRDVANVVVL